MYEIFEPCDESETQTTIQQRIDVQNTSIANVVESLFSSISQAIATQAMQISPVMKLLKQRISRRVKQSERTLNTVVTSLHDTLLSAITENQVRINQVAAELDRFEQSQAVEQSGIAIAAGEALQAPTISRPETIRTEQISPPSAIREIMRQPPPPTPTVPSALRQTILEVFKERETLVRDNAPVEAPPSALHEVDNQGVGGAIQPDRGFPVDLDQPRAFRFWPGDRDWQQRVVEYEGTWLRAFMNSATADQWIDSINIPVTPIEPQRDEILTLR